MSYTQKIASSNSGMRPGSQKGAMGAPGPPVGNSHGSAGGVPTTMVINP